MKVFTCDICGHIIKNDTTYSSYLRPNRYFICDARDGNTIDICQECQKKHVDDYFYKLRRYNGLEPGTPEETASR